MALRRRRTDRDPETEREVEARSGLDVPGGRKGLYYFGNFLVLVGLLLFGSVFVTGCMSFGDFSHFKEDAQSEMGRGIAGMALTIVGAILSHIGARGAAGSGLILDPKQARKDLEPYARMTGGLIKDTLEEADVDLGRGSPERVVMVKCRSCGKLNEEDSKFCQECGKPV